MPDVYNFSKENLETRFSSLLNDQAHLKVVIDWYNSVFEKLLNEKINWGDFGSNPAIKGGYFQDFSLLSLVSQDVAKHIFKRLRENPLLCFQIPHIQTSLYSKLMQNPEFEHMNDLVTRIFNLEPLDLHQEKQRDIEVNRDKQDMIVDLLDLKQFSLTFDDLETISNYVYEYKKELEKGVFLHFTLAQARDMILEIAPTLEVIVDQVIENLVLTQSYIQENVDKPEYSYVKVGSIHSIRLQKDSYSEWFDTYYGFRVVGTAHELMHAIVNELMQIPSFIPGHVMRANREKRTPEDLELINFPAGNLIRVISEAFSLYAESVIAEYLLKNSTYTVLQMLARFQRVRRESQEEYRNYYDKFIQDTSSYGPLPNYYPQFRSALAYVEGEAIVNSLKANNWGLNDLVFLTDLFKQIISEEIGEYDSIKVRRILISNDPKSFYSKITTRIKSLRKYN